MRNLVLMDGFVDLEAGVVARSGARQTLTPKEQELLVLLAEHGGQPVSRDEIHTLVFGYRSGVRTRAADDTIKRLRKKIEQNPSAPQHLYTVRGVGYRLVTSSTTQEVAPGVVGRQEETEALLQRLQEPGIVMLVGLGGIGKSTLARAVMHRWTRQGLFVSLGAARTLDHIISALARSLSVPLHHRTSLAAADTLGQILCQVPGQLLVLDEVEHCVEAVADLLALWMDQQRPLHILVTGRSALSLPGIHHTTLGPLSEEAATVLLKRRGLQLPLSRIRSLARQLGGHPLALELAASGVLPEGMAPVLEPIVQWAWDQMEPAEQHVLTVASLFPEGASLDLLSQVVSARQHLLRSIRRLRARALLQVTDQGWYAPPAPVRKLIPDAAPPLVKRFVDAYHALARSYAEMLEGTEYATGRTLLRQHYGNFIAALHHAIPQQPRVAIQMALLLDEIEQQFISRSAHDHIWEQLKPLLPCGDPVLDDWVALTMSQRARLWSGQHGHPRDFRLEIVRRARKRQDLRLELAALDLACADSRTPDKHALLDRTTALIATPSLTLRQRIQALRSAAAVLIVLGRIPEAVTRLEEACALTPLSAGRHRFVYYNYARLLIRTGESRRAQDILERLGAQMAEDLPFSALIVLSARGWALGQHDPAQALHDMAALSAQLEMYGANNLIACRHRHWVLALKADQGQTVALPETWLQSSSGALISGGAAILAGQQQHDRALMLLRSAQERLQPHRDSLQWHWIHVSMAMLTETPMPSGATHQEPLLEALREQHAASTHVQRASARRLRQSVWGRLWLRARA